MVISSDTALIFAAISSYVYVADAATIYGTPRSARERSSRRRIFPTACPAPAGVEGLCPIIDESVMIVSVSVSIAVSPMTGAASLRRMQESASIS
ncbi:unknown [Lachnospiraceae bacterium CAG:215]|nr:unknown [Lachnospiraceae bacterium CAG:215]